MLRAYGSSADDLQFYSPGDAGDIDLTDGLSTFGKLDDLRRTA